MLKRLILFYLFFSIGQILFSQTNVNAPKIIPVSPNAASLGKFAEVPVSLYTGIPTIDVPIYNIVSGSIQIPLNLSYHAGGVRVEEIASNVGLGWNLTGISVISRTIAGIDDYTPTVGFMNQATTIDQLLMNGNSQALRLDLAKIGARHYDGEPDVYSYNIGKYSGKFYYNQGQQKFIAIPYSPIKIEGDYQNFFKITDPDGVCYTLSNRETTNSSENSGAFVGLANHITSWYITEILDLKTGDKVTFDYETYLSRVFLNGSETRTEPIQEGQCNPTGNPATSASTEMREVQSLRIKKIFFQGGYVEFFKASNTRCDLITDYSLEKVQVFLDDGTKVKDVRFKYSYFQANGNENAPCDEANSRYRRLKLDEVEELNLEGKANNNYKFFYYGDGGIPDRLGFAQDYWGYYNAGNMTTNIPSVTYQGVTYPGANRNAVSNYCLLGTLNKIIYPTGGKTEFVFESNTLKSPTTYNPNNSYSMPFEIQDYYNNYYTTDYQLVFEINSPAGYVSEFRVGGSGYDLSQVYNNTGNPNISLDYGITLSNANNPTVDLLAPLVNCNSNGSSGGCRIITQQSKTFYLYNIPNGTYILSGSVANSEDPYMRSLIVEYLGSMNWYAETVSSVINGYENKVVGGARLKEQHDYASNGNITTKTVYDYNDEQGFSTAQMQTYPNVEGFLYKSYSEMGTASNGIDLCRSLRRTAYSSYPLLYTNGSPVGYKKVRKYQIDGNGKKNGIEEFTFSSYDNAIDVVVNEMPYCPPVSNDWQRGLLLLKSDYKIDNNNTAAQITKTENNYVQINNVSSNIKGVKVAFVNNVYPWVYEGQEVTSPSDIAQIQSIDVKTNTYTLSSSVMKLDMAKKTVFENSIELKEENKFYYNPTTLNVIQEQRKNSKNEQINIFKKYANDFNTTVYSNMYNLNVLTPEIEVAIYKGLDLLKKKLVAYKEIAGTDDNIFVVDEIKSQIKTGPQEIELKFNHYDLMGNILEYQENNNNKKSYIWGYNGVYPIAETLNGGYNEIFHANFEELNGWDGSLNAYDNTKSRTGKYSGRIDKPSAGELTSHSTKWLTISLTGTKKFRYSAWVYSNGPSAELFLFMKRANEPNYFSYVTSVATHELNKWVLIEGEYNVPSDVTQLGVRLDNNGGGTVWFDDVRLYPADAQMMTYTYNPLVGMTSQTDINNRSIYYEYDSFNRLSIIKDNEGRILKKICYNYAGQQEECTATPNWQLTGNTRCKPCPINVAYGSNILQNEQKDLNPSSPTYNQTQWVDAGTSSVCGLAVYENEGSPYCELNSSGQNTGNQLQLRRDKNPCSPTYNQTQVVLVGYNTTACPLPQTCSWSNCNGEGYRCVYGNCEQGFRVYTDSYYDYGTGMTVCVYHYEWSDGTWSQDYYEYNYGGVFCPIMAFN